MGVHYPNVLNDVSACARGERGEEEGELTVAVGIGQWGAGRMSGTMTTQGRRR